MVLILNLSNNLGGGGLQVALSVLEECKKISEHTYHVFLGENVQKQIKLDSFPCFFTFYQIPYMTIYKMRQMYTYFKTLEKQINPDCVFTVFGPTYWKPRVPHLMGFAYGHYIYRDYAFIKRVSIIYKIRSYLREWIHLYLFKYQADRIVVETEDAKERLSKKLKIDSGSINVVSNTCSVHYSHIIPYPNKLPNRKEYEIRLISISKYYLNKNLESIPKVLYELAKRGINQVNFVLTIKHDIYNKIIPEKWRHRVYNVGHVPVIECPSLYNECDIVYLPTLLEIFSASYPEAMAMGKPILTSDLSFARNICKDAALYFDPFNISDITDNIERIIFDKDLYQACVDRGRERLKMFPTSEQRVERYLEICKNMVSIKSLEYIQFSETIP
ncbi:MAG: glycosyltransferase [Bacteroidales bacterium]|jgi:glycosyltransferase involved in cell wall biosynthesis|nr:glycosyltransferase [Bacteroidales bacterium]